MERADFQAAASIFDPGKMNSECVLPAASASSDDIKWVSAASEHEVYGTRAHPRSSGTPRSCRSRTGSDPEQGSSPSWPQAG
eukprot:1786239-Rhodomonas_salina.3